MNPRRPLSLSTSSRQLPHNECSTAPFAHGPLRSRTGPPAAAAAGVGFFCSESEEQSSVRRVAEHYSARCNRSLRQRKASPIINLRNINNWVKSVLIQMSSRPGDSVLDLACGKGGDLLKWDKARVARYVGVDVAEGSIRDCIARYNGDVDRQQRRKRFGFLARLICADGFQARLLDHLREGAPFDICSCQFALHYSWSTEARARQALYNVSTALRPGGLLIATMPDAGVISARLRQAPDLQFGNSLYSVTFNEEHSKKKSPFGVEYKFFLQDAVDCPEWLVPLHAFESLAEEYGLELLLAKNFSDFVDTNMQRPEFAQLMQRFGDGGMSEEEWEVASLYVAVVLRKRGRPPIRSSRGRSVQR